MFWLCKCLTKYTQNRKASAKCNICYHKHIQNKQFLPVKRLWDGIIKNRPTRSNIWAGLFIHYFVCINNMKSVFQLLASFNTSETFDSEWQNAEYWIHLSTSVTHLHPTCYQIQPKSWLCILHLTDSFFFFTFSCYDFAYNLLHLSSFFVLIYCGLKICVLTCTVHY